MFFPFTYLSISYLKKLTETYLLFFLLFTIQYDTINVQGYFTLWTYESKIFTFSFNFPNRDKPTKINMKIHPKLKEKNIKNNQNEEQTEELNKRKLSEI